MKLLLLCLFVCADLSFGQGISEVGADCSCNEKVFLRHYEAKECTPVYRQNECCPAKYICKSEVERGLKPSSCYYKKKEYQIGDTVPIEDACSAACRCRAGFSSGEAKITCAFVECPSLFTRTPPGCRGIYESGKCCETKTVCETEVEGFELATFTRTGGGCDWGGKKYQYGDQIHDLGTDYVCTTCVCTEDFTGPTGIGCSVTDCGLSFRYRENLNKGCTPIYSSCCFHDWMCPDDDRIDKVVLDVEECVMGKYRAPLGQSLPLKDNSINCVCSTPPDFTCKYA